MLKTHFRTRGFIEGGVVRNANHDEFNMAELPPFLRTLLVTDGTVTKSLEAFFWENIKVEKCRQEQCWLTQELPFLRAKIGEHVLKRDVILRGTSTSDIYAYATSFILTDLIEKEMLKQLLAGKIGIGELLREIGLETYREIVDFGQEISCIKTSNDDSAGNINTVFRTYVIYIDGRPAIQINERFPVDLFQKNV